LTRESLWRLMLYPDWLRKVFQTADKGLDGESVFHFSALRDRKN